MQITMTNIEAEFGAAMAVYDLAPAEIIADGKRRRFDAADDKKGKKSAWYILHGDGVPAGAFGNWKTDLSEKWCGKSDQTMTPIENAEYRARVDKARQEAEHTRLQLEADAAAACVRILAGAQEATEDNPYCVRKGIKPYGLKEFKDKRTLIVPIRDAAGAVTSLQFIYEDGTKRLKSHGKVKGCYYSFGGKPTNTLLVCEGFATGASLFAVTDYPVAVAFNAGNLEPVAKALRGKLPGVRIIVCADDDRFNEHGNVGMAKAKAAAAAVGGWLAAPAFQSGEGQPTDFNDMQAREGGKAVMSAINAAKQMTADTGPDLVATRKFVKESIVKAAAAWPKPEPLARSTPEVPYPSEALPEVVLMAVREVQGFTKAPEAMVACSALAALSLAAQSHYDVARAEKLSGPTSLYFLVVAESGERKSTCDGILSKVLREHENRQQEDAQVDIKRYEADQAAWDAIRSGILESIKLAAKSAKDTGQAENALRKHEEMKPEPPRVPRLIYSDFTPEALTYSLAKKWPSGGVISSEAGSVFGSHGMGKESQLRTLANLNQLWDASKLTFDRRGESYVVDGARLTMSLQVQESALMDFIGRTGTLARGTGFLARFLIARPASTQGTRFFTEPPENMPALARFHAQINCILQVSPPINERGGLEPAMLTLSPEAKAAWVKFHDEIESGLGQGGELQDVRDVASKIADNAARMAALFHVVAGGIGPVSVEHFESASIVTAWHLNEALRFFGEIALPDGLANAALLEDWIVAYCMTNGGDTVSTRVVAQYGPSKMRDKGALNAAIQELIEHGRAVLIEKGRKREIQINPQILGGV